MDARAIFSSVLKSPPIKQFAKVGFLDRFAEVEHEGQELGGVFGGTLLVKHAGIILLLDVVIFSLVGLLFNMSGKGQS